MRLKPRFRKIKAVHRRDALARTLKNESKKHGRKPARDMQRFFSQRINHYK